MTHLVAALWQGLIIAAGVDILLRRSRSLSAATRHAIWWATLAAVCGLTTWHLGYAVGGSGVPSALATPDISASRALVVPAPPTWMASALAAAWMVSIACHGWRLASALRAVADLRQRARPLDEAVARALPRWNRLSSRERRAALVVSNEIAGACAVGLSRRPLIVLSDRLVDTLDVEALDQIVLHERAHLARRDDWTRALQWLVTACFGLHPAVLLINNRLALERETACDDQVVAATGTAARYAAALALAADVTARDGGWPSALVPEATEGGTLLVRVRRLLDPGTRRTHGLQAVAVTVSLVTLTAATATAVGLSPILVVASATIAADTQSAALGSGLSVWPGRGHDADSSERMSGTHATLATVELGEPETRRRPGLAPSAQGAPRQSDNQTGDGLAARSMPGNGGSATTGEPSSRDLASPRNESVQPFARADGAEPAPLASTSFGHDVPVPAPATRSTRSSAARRWTTAGAVVAEGFTRFGAATGASSRQTGASIAGFVSRSGKALAARF